MTASDELHIELYRKMQLIRRFEEESARGYAQGKIGGFLHLYIGQEAIAVGACAALRPNDYAITTYRDHAFQHIGILSLEFHVDKLSRPLL